MNKTINGSPGEPPPAAQADAQIVPVDPRVGEDMEILVRIAFAEKFGGFTRALNPIDRSWLWHAVDPATADEAVSAASPPASLEQLPTVRDSLFSLCSHLDILCQNLTSIDPEGAQYIWGLQRCMPPKSPYLCSVARIDGQKQARMLGVGSSDDSGTAVALAMLLTTTIDFPALHRELFPQKYFADTLSG